MIETDDMPPEHISDIVQMALSDHVSFGDIKEQYGLSEKQVKGLMRATLKTGSYKAWRSGRMAAGQRHEALSRCAVSPANPGQDRTLASDIEEPNPAGELLLTR